MPLCFSLCLLVCAFRAVGTRLTSLLTLLNAVSWVYILKAWGFVGLVLHAQTCRAAAGAQIGQAVSNSMINRLTGTGCVNRRPLSKLRMPNGQEPAVFPRLTALAVLWWPRWSSQLFTFYSFSCSISVSLPTASCHLQCVVLITSFHYSTITLPSSSVLQSFFCAGCFLTILLAFPLLVNPLP